MECGRRKLGADAQFAHQRLHIGAIAGTNAKLTGPGQHEKQAMGCAQRLYQRRQQRLGHVIDDALLLLHHRVAQCAQGTGFASTRWNRVGKTGFIEFLIHQQSQALLVHAGYIQVQQ